MENLTIGIEGLVGAGKTSLCRELLKMIPNSILLHGGNLYRGIIVALNSNKELMENYFNKIVNIKELMDILKVSIEIKNRESIVLVDGKQINEEDLQSDKISLEVSKIAKDANNEKLYEFARKLIDLYKERYTVIISGRDLMKIYPSLDYHFFVTADLNERIKRKLKQYNDISKEELEKHIKLRDDLQRESGFYNKYEKTIEIDVTDCKNPEESAKKIFERINL